MGEQFFFNIYVCKLIHYIGVWGGGGGGGVEPSSILLQLWHYVIASFAIELD